MDRRARLATLTGQWPEARSERISAAAPPSAIFAVTTSLAPYDGPWGIEQAAHLLRRTSFGPPYRLFKEAVEKGLEATVNELFSDRPQPGPPINYYFENDPNVPVGATWIDAPYSLSTNLRTYRFNSLRGWTILQMMEEGISIREKLTLFWHNHFAINNINDPRYLYKYIALMRVNAWGNFRELAKAVTIDPAMLRFLNGNQNTRNAPNENYARELLELFTIGKGDLAGPGDYTNYTEEDIREMARVLTGWRDQGFNTINADLKVDSFFRPFQHDTGIKRLSFRFDETEIGNMGDQEYVHLIDIIFQKEEVARHICRKLYR